VTDGGGGCSEEDRSGREKFGIGGDFSRMRDEGERTSNASPPLFYLFIIFDCCMM
jgi:hypothetical protein